MRIDKRLNLVITIDRDDGSAVHVHFTPIATEIFNQYWEIAGQTMNALYTRGFGMFAPRYACQMLRKIAAESAGANPAKQAQEVARVERGFIAEIRRLTNVFSLTDKGWDMLPLHEAVQSGVIDSDEEEEIDAATVFFVLALRSHLKSQMAEVRGALSIWNARTESLACTDFRNSLRTSTAAASSGETATPS